MAGAYSAVVSVMTVMHNLQLHHRPPISLHPKQAESLTQHLNFFEKFLEIYDQSLPYTTEADPLESRIADAAYAAEDAIESHIVDRIKGDGEAMNSSDGGSHEKCRMDIFCDRPAHGEGISSSSDASLYEALENVIKEMESIQKEAIEIKQTMVVGIKHQATPLYSFRSSSVSEKTSMVGVDHLLLQMKEKLVSDYWRDLQTIPVVGMGGTGKTTLAINIYQDRLIKDHFDIRAWATISQQYSIREILLEVLKELKLEDDNKHLSEDALGEILYKHLFGRRYLIVMDDMWSIGAWDGIRRFLPDSGNGSRIMVTTRLSDLASKLSNSNSLKMELLDETDSWDLLSKIVFGGEGCPPELEEIGKDIGKSCKGLPLSIVVIGGFLAKSTHTIEFWKYIKQNLSLIVNLEDYERCLEILYMSYKQLPIYLKPCFLYMGSFSEDDEIKISKLVKLCVAEGFLKPASEGSTLEEIARVYLKHLADRNLVLVNEIGTTGNIKSCKIHDLLRDLCLREAKKERLYTLTSQGKVNGQHWIVISNTKSKDEVINASPSTPPFPCLRQYSRVKNQPPSLRLLRIFRSHVYRSSQYGKIVESVHQFVNSRSLEVSVPSFEVEFPLLIWKFWNLQTLINKGYHDVDAPIDIWWMAHIRHLEFLNGIKLPDPPKDQDGIILGNLQTLQRTTNLKCSDQVVKRIPNLKKLKTRYVGGSPDDDRDCLTNLNRLEKLESLNCMFYDVRARCESVYIGSLINFPHMLKKLCLYLNDPQYLEPELLDKIGSLPFLQKLKLYYGTFKDGKWETTEGQFCSLKSLYLDRCRNLRVWTTESSHFPCLSHLHLTWMNDLEEIPFDLGEVSTLRLIEVWNCTDSAVVSLRRILERYEELHGEADIQVQITLLRFREEVSESKAALGSLAGPNFRIEWNEFRV